MVAPELGVTTPSETQKPPHTSDVPTVSLAGAAKLLADTLNISASRAKALIADYMDNHGGASPRDAAVALAHGADTGDGGDGAGSSSSGSSSSGGSSGGSSASAGPSPQDLRNAAASYEAILTGWGIPITPGIRNSIARAVQAGVSTTAFIQAFRKTKEYAHRFPGIMKANGTLRMTESQYISGYQAARDYAASVGRSLSPQAYGFAVKNGNSPSEIKAKIQAVDTLKTNTDMFQEFNNYLVATGVSKKPMTRHEALRFVMGQGPKAFEQAWTSASDAATLARYSIDVSKPKEGGDLSYRDLKKLQKQLPPGEELDTAALAESLSAMPASALYRMGITQKDRAELAFRTKNAPAIAARVQLTLATARERFNESGQALAPQMRQGGGTSTGQPTGQATE